MRLNGRAVLAVAVALSVLGACDSAERTDDTNRALLGGSASPIGDDGTPEGGPSSSTNPDNGLISRSDGTLLSDLGYNLGSEDAPLKVIEFADFGCGYCRLFHEQTLAYLLEEFVDTNQIEWKLLPFVSGQFENSLAITVGTECTLDQSEDAYRSLAVQVWQSQSEWKPHAAPAALVREWASGLGVDLDEYDACVAEDRPLGRIAGATAYARQLGIRGTPTFWIVGYGPLQGALPLEVFREVLTAVLEEVEAAADSAEAPAGAAGAE